MLNNPNIQPNAVINCWIAAILLFNFKLVHVPATKHQGPDGLSRREPVEGEDDDEDDPKEWIDKTLCLRIWATSTSTTVLCFITTNTPVAVLSMRTASDPLELAIHFPSDDKSRNAEAEMMNIQNYLETLKKPLCIANEDWDQLLRKTKRFFLLGTRLWRRNPTSRDQLFIPPSGRLSIIHTIHNNLGHKGFYSTRCTLTDHFWWPTINQDVKWYISTCHQCQLWQTTKVSIAPSIPAPTPLFRKVYIDTMFMTPATGFHYIVQAHCLLTAWPEWRALCTETGTTLGRFIFEDILCRWGAVEEIVTNNGTAYIEALDWLASKYGIHHIRISAYNSQANRIVERQHRTIQESLLKTCKDNVLRWPLVAPHVFWADQVTTCRSTGHSPFYMAHGIEPILPFNLTLATFLVPDLTTPLSTSDLITIRTRQLQLHKDNLKKIHNNIITSCLLAVSRFESRFTHNIKAHSKAFTIRDLVLIRNSSVNNTHSHKMKPHYFGPMVVVQKTCNRAYCLAKLDGAISCLHFAAFRLVPYHARSRSVISITHLLDPDDLATLDNPTEESDNTDEEA